MRWNKDSEMFIGSVSKGLARVTEIVRKAMEKNYLFVIASDSRPLVKGFAEIVKDQRRIVEPRNVKLGGREMGLFDMILVMYCRKYVLTLRSTFSSVIAQRSGRNPLWICNFLDYVFRYSNSQITWQTLVFHDDDYFCPNRMMKVQKENEVLMRRFFLHFGA
jgi:hypothetical protein